MPNIKTKNSTPPEETLASAPQAGADARPGYRINERVQARLNPYIEAHKGDLSYYTKLVGENPERAARTLMLRDLEIHEKIMERVARQMPYARDFYDQQTPEVRKRIDDAVAAVNPYHHDQAFVGEAVSEYRRQNMKDFFTRKAGEATVPLLGAGKPGSSLSVG